jgi:hypothetical protein
MGGRRGRPCGGRHRWHGDHARGLRMKRNCATGCRADVPIDVAGRYRCVHERTDEDRVPVGNPGYTCARGSNLWVAAEPRPSRRRWPGT